MKDIASRVIYVGKAKNLRSRAGSYFLKAAQEDQRTASWVGEIADIDYLEAESEVDALLMESRLIKDIQPKFNKELKDDKSFPYWMITTREEFPRVELTREPKTKGVKLYGPFTSAGALRGAIQVMQRIFKFRTCSLDITEMMTLALVSPMSLGEYSAVHGVQPRFRRRLPSRYRASDVLDGGKKKLLNGSKKCNGAVKRLV